MDNNSIFDYNVLIKKFTTLRINHQWTNEQTNEYNQGYVQAMNDAVSELKKANKKSSKSTTQPKKAWHIAEDIFFGRKPSYENKYDIVSEINIRASSEALKDGDLEGFALMAGSSRLEDGLSPLFSSQKEKEIKMFGNPKGFLPRVQRIMSKESIETWMDFIDFLKSNGT